MPQKVADGVFKDHFRIVCWPPSHWKSQSQDFFLRHLKQRLNGAFGKPDCFREERPHVLRRTHACGIEVEALNEVDTASLADVMRVAVCGAKNVDTQNARRPRRIRVVRLLGIKAAVIERVDDSAKILRRPGILVHQGTKGARSARMCNERIPFQLRPLHDYSGSLY